MKSLEVRKAGDQSPSVTSTPIYTLFIVIVALTVRSLWPGKGLFFRKSNKAVSEISTLASLFISFNRFSKKTLLEI